MQGINQIVVVFSYFLVVFIHFVYAVFSVVRI